MKKVLHVVLVVSLGVVFTAWAAQSDRITSAIDSGQTVVIKGSVYGKALPQYDRGRVDPGMKLGYMTLQIAPSPAQQASLNKLLADQQDPTSKRYHQWLTPEQFGAQFGLSRNDVNAITNWLQSQGFTILQTARSRNWIAFSGTAAQVEATFHTEIHRYSVGGEKHYANATDISLPKALVGVVTSVRGLHDFLWKPFYVRRHSGDRLLNPDYSNGGVNNLAPDDIATIYDIAPLLTAGYDGTGMTLVIVGQTDIATADITNFRTGFNLPAINLTQVLASGCTDPGTTGDEVEADLDLEWSSAVARNAAIVFDKCDTNDGGVFTALQDAISNNRGPVVSMSYGGCEPLNGQIAATQVQSMVQQANAQGITFMASSGDSGDAACDVSGNPAKAPPATGGLEVNLPASVPETTAVGGSEFNEGSGTYWGSNGTNFGSALGYIPEKGWNDSSSFGGLASTGGGASIYFAKPSWQTGVGVPSDNARDVPDVAITASADHDGYILCSSGTGFNNCAAPGGIPAAVAAGSIVGGTSASSPVFAGIVTLLNQYLVQNGGTAGQGNINPKLYPLVTSTPTAFHDITVGDNIQSCKAGTPAGYPSGQQCPKSGTFALYSAGTGYDQVTGLGSVDSCILVTKWTGGTLPATYATVNLSQSVINVGTGPVTVTVTVAPICTKTGTPTGTVTLYNNGTQINQSGNPVTLSSGTANFSYDTSKLTAGTYSITGNYSGDSSFAASKSMVATLTVGTVSTTTLSPISPSTVAFGTSVTLTANVTSSGGAPPDGEIVTFKDTISNTSLGTAPLSKGAATLTSTTIKGGSYSVVASYPGDANFLPSTSTPAQTLNVQYFTLAASPTTVTITAPGQSGSATITATLYGGLAASSLTFSCSGLPSESNCTFGTVNSSNQVTVTIGTTAASDLRWPQLGRHQQLFYALLLPGLLCVVSMSGRRRTLRGLRLLGLIVILCLPALWLACGGGSSTPSNPGTPAGTSTVTVSATTNGTSPLQNTTTFTLTVQ